ncbi:ParA family protein [Ideonella sp. 4Y11]|uniref:ParA family protein n=1 Tax=Ideonella aquatica TaxID=2824119 RepID=A0A940YP37_9BURK|nr:ParA family protein [Ideonella aquatica]MBQ0959911.1 ParA family protein [Ideonella aquatica]
MAVVSRKGGSGKSTLATNLAVYLARSTGSVTLGDLDHQQSMRVWLARRPSAAPPIVGWVGDSVRLSRPALGTQHLVLDTPGGLHGLGLARVVMVADAILLPVGGSVFDRESASDCWNELRSQPRIMKGQCRVAAVGMRVDSRTHVERITAEWAASVNIPYITSLRMAQIYVRAVENGISLFDMPDNVGATDREQWQPLLNWAEPVFFPQPKDDPLTPSLRLAAKVVPLRPPASQPADTQPVALSPAATASVLSRPSRLSRILSGFLGARR